MSEAGYNASNITNGNLDLSQIPSEDHAKLASHIEQFYRIDSTQKSRLSYEWERNHRFLDGDQWLVFDGFRDTGGIWKRLTVTKANEYIPRPVTNYIFDSYQTLKSYLIKNKPRSTVRPNTQRSRDKLAAKLSELILECNWESLQEQYNYEYAASCVLTYGTVFKKDYWDTSTVATVRVPKFTEPGMEPEFEEMPLGDVNTDIVEPYRITLDPLANDMHKARWIMEYSIQSIDWIKETYGRVGDGYTGRVDEVKPETDLSQSMSRFFNLKNSSGVKSSALSEGGSTSQGNAALTNSAVVKEYYERPSRKYPKGRMIVVASSVTLYAGESPYDGPDLGDWHPYSECRWELVPGRFWGKSPLSAACDIQKQVNSIDSILVLTRKTMATPQKLIPTGTGVPKGIWTGRPGQEIPYRDTGGAKPEIIPGVGVDDSIFAERKQRTEDIKQITGAVDILKGDRPPGVTAASALNMLFEVGTGKLYPILDRWKKFVETSQKKQLKLIAKYYREPRPEFIARLKAKNKSLSENIINRFLGDDLYDNCNVIVEAGSHVPKLKAAEQSRLMEAAQVGTLSLDLPANRMEFNRQMGISGFDNDVSPDIERAEWENDLLDDLALSPDNMPMVLAVDDDALHMEVLARRMKEPSFMDADPIVQQGYMQHYQAHMDAKAQKDQAASLEAMATGQPPQPAPTAASPQPTTESGGGASSEAKSAMLSDIKIPGQIEP